MLVKPPEIRQALLQDFKDFYCSIEGSTPFSLSNLEWQPVSSEEAKFMTRQFSKEEVWSALQETDSNTAPGPDVFNAGWLKELWPHISEKVLFFQRVPS